MEGGCGSGDFGSNDVGSGAGGSCSGVCSGEGEGDGEGEALGEDSGDGVGVSAREVMLEAAATVRTAMSIAAEARRHMTNNHRQ
jgi:hypothetical protein